MSHLADCETVDSILQHYVFWNFSKARAKLKCEPFRQFDPTKRTHMVMMSEALLPILGRQKWIKILDSSIPSHWYRNELQAIPCQPLRKASD